MTFNLSMLVAAVAPLHRRHQPPMPKRSYVRDRPARAPTLARTERRQLTHLHGRRQYRRLFLTAYQLKKEA